MVSIVSESSPPPPPPTRRCVLLQMLSLRSDARQLFTSPELRGALVALQHQACTVLHFTVPYSLFYCISALNCTSLYSTVRHGPFCVGPLHHPELRGALVALQHQAKLEISASLSPPFPLSPPPTPPSHLPIHSAISPLFIAPPLLRPIHTSPCPFAPSLTHSHLPLPIHLLPYPFTPSISRSHLLLPIHIHLPLTHSHLPLPHSHRTGS